jgi:hypothetical protein
MKSSPQVLRELRMGRSLALVSDAGMPAVSDPGAALVRNLKRSCEAVCSLLDEAMQSHATARGDGRQHDATVQPDTRLLLGKAVRLACCVWEANLTSQAINLWCTTWFKDEFNAPAQVSAAAAEGHRVIPIPGPSAVLAALVASGLPTAEFTFVGFLPAKPAARMQALQRLAGAYTAHGSPMQCRGRQGSLDIRCLQYLP